MKKKYLPALLYICCLLVSVIAVSQFSTHIIIAETDDSDFGTEFATFLKDQTIEETVLYDQNNIRITATELTYDNSSVHLGVRLENNTAVNQQFLAGIMGYSVNAINGYMLTGGYLNEDVPSGESFEGSVRFQTAELLFHGITQIADIQVGFEICDDEYNRIYTGPLRVTTPLAADYDYTNDGYRKAINSRALQLTYDYTVNAFAEKEAYNSGGVRILSEAYITNTDGDRTLMLEIQNDNDFSIHLTMNDIKVNETLIYEDAWSYAVVNPACRVIEDIALDDILDEDEWIEYDIDEVESVGFTLKVVNEDGIVITEPKEIVIGV